MSDATLVTILDVPRWRQRVVVVAPQAGAHL